MVAQYDFTFGGTGISSISRLPITAPTRPAPITPSPVVPLTRNPVGTPPPAPAPRLTPNPNLLDGDWFTRMPATTGQRAPAPPPVPVSQASLNAQAARYAGQVVAAPPGQTVPAVVPSPAPAPLGVTAPTPLHPDYPWSTQSTILAGGQGVIPGKASGERTPTPDDPTPTPKPRPTGGTSGDKPSGKPGDELGEGSPDDPVNDYLEEGVALSAEMLGALAARRSAADQMLQQAMQREIDETKRLNLAAETARTQLTREFKNLTQDLMGMLGGRGLARSPLVAGRGLRRISEQREERFGAVSQTLSDEISALQEMVQAAENAHKAELARIAQDEAMAMTPVGGLLPAAGGFGG